MSYKIELNCEKYITPLIDCRGGDGVVGASYWFKIRIPLDRREEVFGTSRALCGAEHPERGFYTAEAMIGREAAWGYGPTPQMNPKLDLDESQHFRAPARWGAFELCCL